MPSKVELTPLCECAVCIEKDRKMNKDKIFKLAKGFRGRAKNCIRIARERVEKALQYSYRDRRTKKRDMRSLWIERINAGSRLHGVCFSFLHTSFFLFNCSVNTAFFNSFLSISPSLISFSIFLTLFDA